MKWEGPEPPESRVFSTTMQVRDLQLVGQPFKYLEGRAVPYDTWGDVGWYLEQHQKGSLTKSTNGGSGKNLPLLLFHDNQRWPIGVADQWDHRDDGLHGVWRLNETHDAQQAALLADSGDLGFMSIGFAPIRSDWELVEDYDPSKGPEHKDRVTRTESRLLEVSLTPTPVFKEAEIVLVRTAERTRQRGESRREVWKRELEQLRR
jgi:HK97 family phage prohead protease